MKSGLSILARTLLFVYGSATLLAVLFFGLLNKDQAAVYEMAGQQTDSSTIAGIRAMYRLDEPMPMQVAGYLNDLSPISLYKNEVPQVPHLGFSVGTVQLVLKQPWFGRSYQSNRAVHHYIWEAIPQTVILALSSLFFAAVGGIGLGVLSHRFKVGWLERLLLTLASTGMALPSFFSAVLISWLLGYVWHSYTGLYPWGNLYEIDDWTGASRLVWSNVLLPTLTLAVRPLAVLMQMTKNSLEEAQHLPHVRTATAKGLSKQGVLFKHVLRNALGPVWTSLSGWLGNLLAGAVFVEYIFGWKGLGQLLIQSLTGMDYPILMGCIVTIAALFSALQGLTDSVHQSLDPRLRRT